MSIIRILSYWSGCFGNTQLHFLFIQLSRYVSRWVGSEWYDGFFLAPKYVISLGRGRYAPPLSIGFHSAGSQTNSSIWRLSPRVLG